MAEDDDQPVTKGDLRSMENRLTARLDRMENSFDNVRDRVSENEKRIGRHNGIFWLIGTLLVGVVGWVADRAGAGVMG